MLESKNHLRRFGTGQGHSHFFFPISVASFSLLSSRASSTSLSIPRSFNAPCESNPISFILVEGGQYAVLADSCCIP